MASKPKQSFLFTVWTISHGENLFTGSQIDSISEQQAQVDKIDDEIVSFSGIKGIETGYERFKAFVFTEGSRFPYSGMVVNVESGGLIQERNPKKISQVEPQNTLYVLFDKKKSRVFLSDARRIKDFIKWMESSGFNGVACRPLVNKDEFLSTLARVGSLKLTYEPEHQGEDANLDEVLHTDIYGRGVVEKYGIDIKFKKKASIDSVKAVVSDIFGKKQNQHLTIKGNTAEKFLTIFNGTEVVVRVPLKISFDKSAGAVSVGEVFANLIDRINREMK